MLKFLKNFLLDLFFPKKCLGCNKPGTYICDSCLNKIELAQIVSPRLTSPGLDTVQKISSLDRLIWAVPYSNPLVKELIRIFKYHYIKELAKPLSQFLIAQCGRSYLPHNAVIVPVPLHKRKLRERGYNQAELLAKEVAEHFSLPLETNVLIRKKYTPQQARKKNEQERREALKDAFEIAPDFMEKCVNQGKNLLSEKNVILVDDVFTTGSTLCEAAKVLKRAGAKEVWGLVIAKG